MKNDFLIPIIRLAGNSEEAINYYLKVFPKSELIDLVKFTEDTEYTEKGKVLKAQLKLENSTVMFMDMKKEIAPMSSWAISLFLNFEIEEEFDQVFKGLAELGQVMFGPMPAPETRKVAMVTDKFNITWELNWK
ncbi:MAG: VOC family protein [Acetobacterium sp.]